MSAVLQRGAWVNLILRDGSRRVCRVARPGPGLIAFDHGAYGRARHDFFVRAEGIAVVEPAARPALMLTYRDPSGFLCRVGRFESRAEAEAAIEPMRRLIHDVRIEMTPNGLIPVLRAGLRHG